jgi:hypothetical protein
MSEPGKQPKVDPNDPAFLALARLAVLAPTLGLRDQDAEETLLRVIEERDQLRVAVILARQENATLQETLRQARNVQAGICRLFPEVAATILAALDRNEARALLAHDEDTTV